MISSLCLHLLNICAPDKLSQILKWEVDCELQLSSHDWDMIENLTKRTKFLTIRETAIQLFTLWHFSPTKLHTIYPLKSVSCFRICSAPVTLLHIFCICNTIIPIWHKVQQFLMILGQLTQLTVANCLLYAPIPNPFCAEKLIHTLCIANILVIALNWKSSMVSFLLIISCEGDKTGVPLLFTIAKETISCGC